MRFVYYSKHSLIPGTGQIEGKCVETDVSQELMTVLEVAETTKVRVETVRRWIKDGKLPAHRTGRRGGFRVRRGDLEAFLGLPSPVRDENQGPAIQLTSFVDRIRSAPAAGSG
jgi:excisionase family DNA binding protein